MQFKFLLLSTTVLMSTVDATSSTKRGLIYIPSKKYPDDDSIWTKPGSDLTWYYNYTPNPSPSLSKTKLQFVPMLWGAKAGETSTPFLDTIQSLVKNGQNISYILAFNEPDGDVKTGGSSISPSVAASTWIREIEPLSKLGVKLGAPAVTGSPKGQEWLGNFFNACNGRCNPSFIPVHWYGSMEGLASHIGQVTDTYPKLPVWVTEYALSGAKLKETQQFYNQSSALLDRWSNVTHYSYFGSFRSDVSNVGASAAMLTQKGQLTDIGSWYLGGSATGAVPQGAGSSISVSMTTLFLLISAALWNALS